MKLIDRFKGTIRSHFDKKKEKREFEERLEREARANERQIYEVEYKKASLKAIMLRAKQDAENKTGLAKLRAINQLHNVASPKMNIFSKLSHYTRSNLVRKDANIKRVEAMRTAAKQDSIRKLEENKVRNLNRVPMNLKSNRPFSDINKVIRR